MLQRHVSPCVVILLKIMHLGSCANFVHATCRTKLNRLKFVLFVGTKLLHNSRCTRVKCITKHYQACCCNTCHQQMSLLHFLPCVQLFILSLSYFLATRPCYKPFSEYGTGFCRWHATCPCNMSLQHVPSCYGTLNLHIERNCLQIVATLLEAKIQLIQFSEANKDLSE